jgi:hypothetical protein
LFLQEQIKDISVHCAREEGALREEREGRRDIIDGGREKGMVAERRAWRQREGHGGREKGNHMLRHLHPANFQKVESSVKGSVLDYTTLNCASCKSKVNYSLQTFYSVTQM